MSSTRQKEERQKKRKAKEEKSNCRCNCSIEKKRNSDTTHLYYWIGVDHKKIGNKEAKGAHLYYQRRSPKVNKKSKTNAPIIGIN